MVYLPSELLENILSRCPAESVLRLQNVSPVWRAMARDPKFIATHLRRAPAAALFHSYTIQPRGHSLCSYGSRREEEDGNLNPIPNFPGAEGADHLEIMGSPNGILCVVQYIDFSDFTLFNPSTEDSLPVPEPTLNLDQETHISVSVGFGFDPEKEDYTIIRVLARSDNLPDDIEVLSINLGHWVPLRNHNLKLRLDDSLSTVVKGTPYWRSTREDASGRLQEKLVWFDVGAKSFRVQDFPWVTETNEQTFMGTLGDCLCMLVWDVGMNNFDVWLRVGSVGWRRAYRDVQVVAGDVVVGFYGVAGIVTMEEGNHRLLHMYDLRTGEEVDHATVEEEVDPDEFVRAVSWKDNITRLPLLGEHAVLQQ